MACEFPEGCTCGASQFNSLLADLAARDAELVKAQQQVEYLNTVVLGLGQEKVDLRAQLSAANSRADSLEREVERLTGIERSHNAQRNLAPDQRTIPDDDAGRAAYWKGRAKGIEGDFARLSDSLLKEGEAKDAAHAEATKLVELLKVAICPDQNCDGKGSSWHVEQSSQTGEPEQVQHQCQWCDERDTALTQYRHLPAPEGGK